MSQTNRILEDNSFDVNQLLKNETLFHTANGYVGMRGNFEEGYAEGIQTIRGTYINGFYDIGELKYTEKFKGFPEEYQKLVNIVDIQGIELWINKERFSLFEGKIIEFKRLLDMNKGYSVRNIIWESPNGHQIEIKIKRMASFTVLELVTIEYEVTSINFNGGIKIKSTQNGNVKNFSDASDPRLAHESLQNIIVDHVEKFDNYSIMEVHTSVSGLRLVSGVHHSVNGRLTEEYFAEKNCSYSVFEGGIKQGETIILTKMAVFTDSRRYVNYKDKAMEILNYVTALNLDFWYGQQETYLNKFWNSALMEVDGQEKLTAGICYNMYGLLESVGKDIYANIAAKGLSGEGYEGHYFWDTEIYIFPFFLLTQKKIAKNLLSFRYHILNQAREHARLLGHKKGALYPWRTITGTECSSYFPSGSAQYHINGDIAYTFIQYFLVTQELDFVEEMGAEVLCEIARLWMDTGNYDNGQFKINCVTGPDEYTCLVNNNYYTNAGAKYSLIWAVKFYQLLKKADKTDSLRKKISLTEEEVISWEKAADKMYLPVEEIKEYGETGRSLKVNPQDDSFLHKKMWDFEHTSKDEYPLLLHFHPMHLYRHQVLKQADTVLAHFLFEDYQDIGIIRDSYEYYEKITTHDSSLSACIYSIMAAKLGMAEKAFRYFIQTARFDLDDNHGNTKHGIHTANMGGTYMGMVYGFAGLRIKETGLYFTPNLPKELKGFSFKMNFRNRELNIQIRDNKFTVDVLNGKDLDIFVQEKLYKVSNTLTVALS